MTRRTYRAEPARTMPENSPNRFMVFDYTHSQVARLGGKTYDTGGRLAYFRTRKVAETVAELLEVGMHDAANAYARRIWDDLAPADELAERVRQTAAELDALAAETARPNTPTAMDEQQTKRVDRCVADWPNVKFQRTANGLQITWHDPYGGFDAHFIPRSRVARMLILNTSEA